MYEPSEYSQICANLLMITWQLFIYKSLFLLWGNTRFPSMTTSFLYKTRFYTEEIPGNTAIFQNLSVTPVSIREVICISHTLNINESQVFKIVVSYSKNVMGISSYWKLPCVVTSICDGLLLLLTGFRECQRNAHDWMISLLFQEDGYEDRGCSWKNRWRKAYVLC